MRTTIFTTALVASLASMVVAAPTPAPEPALLTGLGNGLTNTVNSIIPASLGKDLSNLAAQLGITVDELVGRITTPLGVSVTGQKSSKRGLLSASPLTGLLGNLPILSQLETPLFGLIANLGTNINSLVSKLGLGNVIALSSVAGGNNLGMTPSQLSTFLTTIATKLGMTVQQLLASLNLTGLNLPNLPARGLFDSLPLKNFPLVGALVNQLLTPLTFLASGLSVTINSLTSKLGLDGLLSLAAIQNGGLDASTLQGAITSLATKLGITVQQLVAQLTASGLDLSKLPVGFGAIGA